MHPCNQPAVAKNDPAVTLISPSAVVNDGTSDPAIQKMQDDSLATLSPTSSGLFHSTLHTNDRALPVPALSMLTSDPHSVQEPLLLVRTPEWVAQNVGPDSFTNPVLIATAIDTKVRHGRSS
jgi:hypothetical protein